MLKQIFRNRRIIFYGLSMALLLFLLKWLELRLIIIDHAFELYAGTIAVLFTLIGIWLARYILDFKSAVQQSPPFPERPFEPPGTTISNLNISKRELEVLYLISKGLSNQEIAAELFVSVSTVKTHVSNLFEKLDVRRRTQALEKAKQLKLLP
ncbi:MAG TPA: response regulator transcription factor [Flavobacterium sp.]|jgi:DNA-binding CsgD family transcriptional regulator